MGFRSIRLAGGACVVVLILGVPLWGMAASGETGCGSPSGASDRLAGAELPPTEESASLEGAKTAVGWAVGLDFGGYATILHTTDGLLLHTRDGGQSWEAEGDPADLAGNGLIAVSALDSTTAWAVGENGLILHTRDGGGGWVRQGKGQVPVVAFNGVYAADAQHAWAVGPEETGNKYGTIVRTADGGQTWLKVPYSITHTTHPSAVYLITVHGAAPTRSGPWGATRSSTSSLAGARSASPTRRRI